MNFYQTNYQNIYQYYCIECKTKRAQFNYKRIYPEQYCRDCKKEGMVDSKKYICNDNDCLHVARYIQEGDKIPKYCRDHIKGNFISIDPESKNCYRKSYCCKNKDCYRKSIYNTEGEKIPEYCWKHKKENMKPYDFNFCLQCDNIAKYDYSHKSLVGADFCYEHKEEGMYNIYTQHCSHENCEELGIYGHEKEVIYCSEHMKNDMIVQNENICKTLYCEKNIHKNSNNGYCSYCFVNLFPEEAKNSRMKNSKELHIIQFIMKMIPDKNFVFNKKINNARPDIVLKLDSQNIIIEIDENQHKNYDQICEKKRINELYCDLQFKNIVLIRFNPDKYTDSYKNIKESCFKLSQNGKCILDLKQKKEYEKRMKKLVDTITYYINHNTNEALTTIHLFFDNYSDDEESKKYMKITNIFTV